jgi:peptidoglycan L-alanyl-D-glutamate endopeptidase CwlK
LQLHVKDAAGKALANLAQGTYYIAETYRLYEVTEAYYAKGRRPPAEVRYLYALAGLPPPDNYNIITNAKPGTSAHCKRIAIDVVPVIDGKVTWAYNEENKQHWQTIARAFKNAGFIWGGDWEDFRDYPHYEYPEGR